MKTDETTLQRQLADKMQAGKGNLDTPNSLMPKSHASTQNPEVRQHSKMQEIDAMIKNAVEFGAINAQQAEIIRQGLLNAVDAVGDVDGAQIPEMIDLNNLHENDFKFFETRQDLKKYLQDIGAQLDRGEFEKIFELVQQLEVEAVNRFQQMAAGEFSQEQPEQILPEGGNLKQQQDAAKDRLKTASSRAHHGGIDVVKRFSPEQIGKMTSAEFMKNEAAINRQLREGKF